MLIYFCFIVSYSGALLHSFIPHHHHTTVEEATNHHHHAKSHSHDDGKDKQDKRSSEPYLLSHAANADVLINHAPNGSTVKAKKIDFNIALTVSIQSSYSFTKSIFRLPQNERVAFQLTYSFSSLRGPPAFA